MLVGKKDNGKSVKYVKIVRNRLEFMCIQAAVITRSSVIFPICSCLLSLLASLHT